MIELSDKTQVVHYCGIPLRLTMDEYVELRALIRDDVVAADEKCREYVERAYGRLK